MKDGLGKIGKLFLLFLVLTMPASLVRADGWYPSDEFLHLNEPNQKAIISWDGETETMILSAAVRSEEIANFAWIVPIQSYTKPYVTDSNISIFKDLVNYFEVERPQSYGKDTMGVEVLETKEIDVYDVTILRADSADDLINWLKQNGYKVPDNAESVISYYVKNGNSYFVANKIDLRNKYADVVDFLKNFSFGRVDPSYNPIGTNTYRIVSTLLTYDVDDVSHRLTTYILSNTPYETPLSRNWVDFFFLSKDEYNNLKNQYALDFDESLQDRMRNVVSYAKYSKSLSIYCSYHGDTSKIYLYGSGGNEEVYLGSCNDLINDFGSLDNVRSELSKMSWSDVRERYNSVKSQLKTIIEDRYKEISPMRERLQEFYEEERNLMDGIATPLEFKFKPRKLYYPLKISSLNTGYGNIEVYVISKNPVKDENDVLKVDSIKKINSQLKSKIEKFIPVNGEYVTRLYYRGDLEKLSDDSVFEESSQPISPSIVETHETPQRTNFIEVMSNLILSIFMRFWPF